MQSILYLKLYLSLNRYTVKLELKMINFLIMLMHALIFLINFVCVYLSGRC